MQGSYSLTQFKHGSTEIAQIFKKDVVFRLETKEEKFKAERSVFFFLSEPK
jgi:hypothetical protein